MRKEGKGAAQLAVARICLGFLALSGCLHDLVMAGPRSTSVVRARYLMGTIFRFEAPEAESPSKTAAALEAALDEVGRLEEVLSNWRSESELSRLNAGAGKGATQVSPQLFDAVSSSLTWARETGGAFDPTVEPLTRRFRSGPSLTQSALGESSSSGTPSVVGWNQVRLDPQTRTVAMPAGAGLDMGGVAKGIALDRASRVLAQHGVHDALLDAGGQFLPLGSPPGELGWTVALADPGDRQRPTYTLMLSDVSLATSGNSERPGEIVDPTTLRPVVGRFSASALAPDATSADALSTALFVMGPERGEAWARARSDLLALFLVPAEKAGTLPRASGTLRLAPSGHFLVIAARPRDGHRRLDVEIR